MQHGIDSRPSKSFYFAQIYFIGNGTLIADGGSSQRYTGVDFVPGDGGGGGGGIIHIVANNSLNFTNYQVISVNRGTGKGKACNGFSTETGKEICLRVLRFVSACVKALMKARTKPLKWKTVQLSIF